jgi:hypothetical protein
MHNGGFSITSNMTRVKREEVFNGLGTQFAVEAKKQGFDQFSCTTKKGNKKWLHFRFKGVSMKCTSEMDVKGQITVTIMDSDHGAPGSSDALWKVFNTLFVKEQTTDKATAPLEEKKGVLATA